MDRLYRTLETPWVYRLVQEMMAPGATGMLGDLAADEFATSVGPVLDVGCGPKLTTLAPSQGLLVGADINAAYLASYREGFDRGVVQASADRLPFADGSFNEARSWGLLHHLPPETAARCVSELSRCVRPGGRVVIFDNVWPRLALTRPLAWLVRRLDRGDWIRTEDDLRGLVEGAAPGAWGCRRLTYSYNGLEGLLFTRTVT